MYIIQIFKRYFGVVKVSTICCNSIFRAELRLNTIAIDLEGLSSLKGIYAIPSFHKGKEMQKILEDSGHSLLYLPQKTCAVWMSLKIKLCLLRSRHDNGKRFL
jgi:hypothetical protein